MQSINSRGTKGFVDSNVNMLGSVAGCSAVGGAHYAFLTPQNTDWIQIAASENCMLKLHVALPLRGCSKSALIVKASFNLKPQFTYSAIVMWKRGVTPHGV